MEKEDKELLLKDLCARLPYKVICEDGYGNVLELNGIDKPNTITFKCSDNTFWTTDLDKCKPYLFPLSSMTDGQKSFFDSKHIEIDDYLGIIALFSDVDCKEWDEVFCWLNENHFDYRGLIEKGLAKDATGLNIY